MTTINKQVSASTDDCHEADDTTIYLTNTTTIVGRTTLSLDTGLRWHTVNIPQAATITTATLSLYLTADNGTLSANIRGIDEDNTVTWAADDRPSQRTKTTATITANEANWGNWGIDGWVTIDIASVIQEIVDRGGWSANNALAIVIENTGGDNFNYSSMRSWDYAGNAHGAKLDIVYNEVNKQISLGTDDCYETDDTSINSTSNGLFCGYVSGVYDAGLRWQTINIAQATTISSAKLSLYLTGDTGTLSANIRGIDEDNTVTWATDDRPSQRTKTSATITANEANWNNWAVDGWIDIDITSVVQEIIDRGGWAANNALAIVIEDTAGTGTNYIGARTYEYTGNVHGAKLDIVYGGAPTVKPAWYYEMLKRRNSQ